MRVSRQTAVRALLLDAILALRHAWRESEWTGLAAEPIPLEARCSAGEPGRCVMTSPVFVLV